MTSTDGPPPDGTHDDGFGTGDPQAEKYLQAYEMWSRDQRSLAFIAEHFRIGKTTAHTWVHKGEELVPAALLLDIRRGRRGEIEFMRAVKERIFELCAELDPAEQVKALDVAVRASKRQAELGGYDMPTRSAASIEWNPAQRGPVVDGRVVSDVALALENYQSGGDPRDGQPGAPGPGERSW